MPAFFKKSDNGPAEAQGDESSSGPSAQHRQQSASPVRVADEVDDPPADEHTRLLPNRVDSNRALLTPDDPAVSPYNLWSIRFLRHLTLFLAVVSFAWCVVLLVAVFATPPGFNTRGGSFLAFGFSSLTLANVLFTLVFFGVPSQLVRVLTAAMALILLLDMILLLAVQQTRYEERWVGIASVVWALLMSLWTLVVDRTVQWGKREEEERLTGRAETRRTLTEWLAVLLSTIGVILMDLAVVLITMTIILRALDAGVAAPGKLYQVDGGKYRLHLYCHEAETQTDHEQAKRRPTVFIEGGERPVEQGLWAVAEAAVKNGSISRYCFVDRPGIAWSDAAPSPLSAGFAVDALGEALAQANETGPWVLVGAGVGSIYTRVFSVRHSHEVKGLVLIDPLHEDLLGQVAAPGRGFLLWLRGVISPLGLDRLPGAIFRGRTSRDRIYGRAVQQGSKFIFAKLQESLVMDSFSKRDLLSSRQIQDRKTPLVVISSGRMVKQSARWEEKQRDLTKLTDELRHWDIVDEAPHQVWETAEGREQIEKRLRELVEA